MRPLHCMFVAATLLVGACEAKTQQEVVDEATRAAQEAKRQAQQGVEVARDGTRKVVDEATRQAEQGAEIAARKAEQGMAEARSQIADARERLELAKKNLDHNMDDAADAFEAAAEEAAETSKKQADQLGKQADQLGKQIGEAKSGLRIAPDAILCDGNSQSRICRISPALIAELATEPRMLAREVSLRPGKGDTGKGLELARAAAEGFAAALGLREGDILLELNGAKLDSFGAIRELDGALSGKPEAKLIYEREGQREELTVMQQPLPQ